MWDLAKTYWRFESELNRVEQSFDVLLNARSGTNSRELEPAFEGCLVYSLDVWGRYVRALVICSSWRRVRSLAGQDYGPPPFNSKQLVFDHLAANRNQITNFSHKQPSWHLQHSAIDAINVLSPPNKGAITGALGASVTSSPIDPWLTTPLSDLHLIRNFVCHRGPYAGVRVKPVLNAADVPGPVEWMCKKVNEAPLFRELIVSLRSQAMAMAQ